jgi:DNA-directed RNA polymerase
MDAVWPAIGDVVVKGVQLMSWLKTSSRKIVKHGKDPVISWMSPSGFPAHQTYYKTASFQVKTRLHGSYYIRTTEKKDEPDAGRHASGMAPNFVHSLDAAHLHMTVAALAEQGVTSIKSSLRCTLHMILYKNCVASIHTLLIHQVRVVLT